MINKKDVFKELIKMFQDTNFSIIKFKNDLNNYINDGFNINSKYNNGKTIAHLIVKYSKSGLFNYLVQLGLNIDICDDSYDAPIHEAVKLHNIMMVQELLMCGADINAPSEFEATPLHLAVAEKDDTMVEFLIKMHADTSLVDEKNNSAYDYAKDDNNIDIINIFEKYC